MPDDNPLLATLPEDIRAEPSLATIKDVPTLAKSYVHAQKLIGAKRLVAPQENWNGQQWDEFFDAVGRPKAATEYEVPTIPDLDPDVKIDDAQRTATLGELHKLGLTKKQAAGVLSLYLKSIDGQVKGAKTKMRTEADAGTNALKQEWGDKFDANVDVARSVIKKFAGDKADELVKWLDASGMGNNVHLARLLFSVGKAVQEDHRRGGGTGDLPMGDQARATQEIEQLRLDKNFQEALGSANHQGHRAAVERWVNLHAAAYPGKSD